MFPKNSYTDFFYFQGAGTHTVTSTPATILGYSFKQGNVSSDTDLLCGTTLLFKNKSTDIQFTPTIYYCADGINYSKTGQDDAMVVTTYIAGNYSATVDATTSVELSTTSFPQYTQGDFFTQFLLIIMILIMAFGGMYTAIFGRKTRVMWYNRER